MLKLSKIKKVFTNFREVSGVFRQNFNGSKIMLSSSRGQGNFRGLEASRPRPRTSKCVLEDVLETKDVLEDSTSDTHSTNHQQCTVQTRDGNRSGRPAGQVAGPVEILRPVGQAC